MSPPLRCRGTSGYNTAAHEPVYVGIPNRVAVRSAFDNNLYGDAAFGNLVGGGYGTSDHVGKTVLKREHHPCDEAIQRSPICAMRMASANEWLCPRAWCRTDQ